MWICRYFGRFDISPSQTRQWRFHHQYLHQKGSNLDHTKYQPCFACYYKHIGYCCIYSFEVYLIEIMVFEYLFFGFHHIILVYVGSVPESTHHHENPSVCRPM
jgi:hypothetical protein